MQESQAGEKSPSPPQNKFPWEAGFWGEVGGVINQVYTGIKEAINSPPKDPPVIEPWDARFWRGNVKTNPPPTANLMGYLNRLSSAESSNRPGIKAKTSTASGLYQFTEETWMEAVSRMKLPFTLSDRFDPKKAQQVVEATTLKNYERAKNELGRNPNQTELYMYHLLGGFGASKFFKADANTLVSDIVSPAALKANKALFNGKTVKDLLDHFHPKFGREEVVLDNEPKDQQSELERDIAIQSILNKLGIKYNIGKDSNIPGTYRDSTPKNLVVVKPRRDGPLTEREYNEKQVYVNFNTLVDSPLQTEKGREEWLDKVFQEALKQDPRTRKLDPKALEEKLSKRGVAFGYLSQLLEKEGPLSDALRKEVTMYDYFLRNRIDGIPDHVKKHFKKHGQIALTFLDNIPGAHGFVYSNKPDRIFIDRQNADLNTLIHELEHIRQSGDVSQFGQNAPHITAASYRIGEGMHGFYRIRELLEKNRDMEGIRKVFNKGNSWTNTKEFLANVQAYMTENNLTEFKQTGVLADLISRGLSPSEAERLAKHVDMVLQRDPEYVGESDTTPGVWDKQMQKIMRGKK